MFDATELIKPLLSLNLKETNEMVGLCTCVIFMFSVFFCSQILSSQTVTKFLLMRTICEFFLFILGYRNELKKQILILAVQSISQNFSQLISTIFLTNHAEFYNYHLVQWLREYNKLIYLFLLLPIVYCHSWLITFTGRNIKANRSA